MTDWTYNNFLGNSKKVTPMKYNEPFTMNDKQLARFKAGKKVFSEGKCAVVREDDYPFKYTYYSKEFEYTTDFYVYRPWGSET